MERFKEALLEVKEAKGYSWAQIAQITGRARGQLPGMLSNPKKQKVTKAFANDIFARLSGVVLEATPLQKKQYTARAHRVQANIRAETLRDGKLQSRRREVDDLKERLGLA